MALQKQVESSQEVDEASLFEDDFFASMVSPQGIIQIGEWVFKIDLRREKVYALPASETSLVANLKQAQPSHDKIRVFSTSDDVLDMIENGMYGDSSVESGIAT
ncbi:hypothetical protein [uncultured Pontibacter sp.]|uniref:hypothetical protein n=1 Tax=uncultured Pontibacter sp. TaxID=453356 RepID=UPI00261748A8|nr:hypothetical protein [uncultured Pontibacter sp.]